MACQSQRRHGPIISRPSRYCWRIGDVPGGWPSPRRFAPPLPQFWGRGSGCVEVIRFDRSPGASNRNVDQKQIRRGGGGSGVVTLPFPSVASGFGDSRPPDPPPVSTRPVTSTATGRDRPDPQTPTSDPLPQNWGRGGAKRRGEGHPR